jgi:hypothetical protein
MKAEEFFDDFIGINVNDFSKLKTAVILPDGEKYGLCVSSSTTFDPKNNDREKYVVLYPCEFNETCDLKSLIYYVNQLTGEENLNGMEITLQMDENTFVEDFIPRRHYESDTIYFDASVIYKHGIMARFPELDMSNTYEFEAGNYVIKLVPGDLYVLDDKDFYVYGGVSTDRTNYGQHMFYQLNGDSMFSAGKNGTNKKLKKFDDSYNEIKYAYDVPPVGYKCKFFDDGIISYSRCYDAVVKQIVPKEESHNIMFDVYDDDTDSYKKISLYDLWKYNIKMIEGVKSCEKLYSKDTDVFIECLIPEYVEKNVWAVRSDSEGWFSIDINVAYYTSGTLDVSGKYEKMYNEYIELSERIFSKEHSEEQ